MDMLQHVNNVTYVDYLQEARIDMFTSHPEFRGGEDLGEGVVVVRHELEFRAPLTFRSRPVLIDSWISRIRAASFTMDYEVYDEPEPGSGERRVYLRASSVLAPFVFATERPRRLSDVEREVLGRYLDPADRRPPLPPIRVPPSPSRGRRGTSSRCGCAGRTLTPTATSTTSCTSSTSRRPGS